MNANETLIPISDRMADLIDGQKERVILGNSEIIIVRPDDGKRVDVYGLVGSHYDRQTDFGHCVVDLGDRFKRMKNSVISEEERWEIGQNLPPQVSIVPNDEAMDQMTIFANTPGVYENSELKKEYRKSLAGVMAGIKESGKLNPVATPVAIKRAGVVAAEMLDGKNNALVFEAKRLPFQNGHLGVGIEDEDGILNAGNLHGKEIEIDEVFLASGSTLIALMLELNLRGIEPKSLAIVAPFATQQGIEAVLKTSTSLGWKTKIVASRIYYALDENLYVLVTPQEKVWQEITKGDKSVMVQAGGDAGDLTEIE